MTTINSEINITSPSVIYIMKTIKAIQKRMKDSDIINMSYAEIYETLGTEFSDFFDKHANIFTKVIRGEDLRIISSVLYYRDKIEKGLMTEEELSEILAKKYLPENLKQESDMEIKKMRSLKQI